MVKLQKRVIKNVFCILIFGEKLFFGKKEK